MSQRVGSGVQSATGAAYDPATQADRSFVVNADHLHYVYDDLNDTNLPDDTYDLYLDMSSYKRCDVNMFLDTVGSAGTATVTFWASLQDTAAGGDVPPDEWEDVSIALYGSASYPGPAAAKTSFMLQDTDNRAGGFKWLRIRIIVAGGSSDINYKIYPKRLY